MYATKRKIHNLLNAATGNPSVKESTPSTPPKAAAPTTPTKADHTFATPATPDQNGTGRKRKIDEVPPPSPAPSSYSIRPVSAAGSVVSVSSGIPGRQHPTYQPWDRHEFLDRLSSYRSVDRWGAKPVEVNEVEWAKRGWECIGKERVRCVSCRAEVVVQVEVEGGAHGDDDGDVTLEDVEGSLSISAEIVRRYQELIVTSHDESCQWRKRGCEDTIYHLPLAKASNSLPPFLTRYHSLLPLTDSIPPTLTYPTIDPPLTSLDITALTRFLTSFPTHATNTINTTTPNGNALVLALFGWECEDPKIPLLHCSACFRRLGLWLFKADEGGDEASVSKLDVKGEHRDYCPWANSTTQGGEEGWITLLRVARREGSSKKTSPDVILAGTASDAGSVTQGSPGPASDGKEKTANLESRLKRLKTVYFGKGKKRNSIGGGILEKKA
ncbi:zf-C3HC-domain-containing protein [Ascobolus immersus RN42]|uniref:Zf-C3HC-domain-containing protein n=1 Tax=Ascobolus immersus RN42 TaxID=1160509 RepID=A0A3N4HD97_ASCIM|nr:zf-C3HC-domain-containing protein [Ascobolus immersus RN42]